MATLTELIVPENGLHTCPKQRPDPMLTAPSFRITLPVGEIL